MEASMTLLPIKQSSSESLQEPTTFLGKLMHHNYWLYSIIEDVFKNNNQIQSIVEIGTGSGTLTMFLGLWGIQKSIRVLSIDSIDLSDKKVIETIGVQVIKIDQYSHEAQELIIRHIRNRPTYLYCDGKNKKWEFNNFVPILPRKSVVSIHDFGNECNMKDIREICKEYCNPYKKEKWMEMNVNLATFIVK